MGLRDKRYPYLPAPFFFFWTIVEPKQSKARLFNYLRANCCSSCLTLHHAQPLQGTGKPPYAITLCSVEARDDIAVLDSNQNSHTIRRFLNTSFQELVCAHPQYLFSSIRNFMRSTTPYSNIRAVGCFPIVAHMGEMSQCLVRYAFKCHTMVVYVFP